MSKNPHAIALGKIKSDKKAEAARENGKKGGRPTQEKRLIKAAETIAWYITESFEEDHWLYKDARFILEQIEREYRLTH